LRKFLWITMVLPTLLLVVPATADAQLAHTRSGFWFSGGMGYGSFGCQNCEGREGGMSGGLALGTTLNQQLLLGIGTNGWTKSEDGARLTAGTLTASARYYPAAQSGLYVMGGLGLGTIDVGISGFASARETGLGAIVGVGYDFRIMPNVSLSPYWNGVGLRINEGNSNFAQLGLGITLH
jgi:hypothetical protein